MEIRRATRGDLDIIMGIYDAARQTMRANGNLTQWVNGYPSRELIEGDIARGECYVISDESAATSDAAAEQPICGVFMFAIGDDPTYAIIENGSWLNDAPYGVIHRIGSDGRTHGLLRKAVQFALARVDNVRIDTHADNAIMQHALEKAGFRRCGTIYCQDGTPRVAFHLAN